MTRRPGFSIVEVVVALVILAVALVGLQTATAAFLRRTAGGERAAGAAQLAEDRLEMVRADPVYAALEARYDGVENDLPGWDGYTRETSIVHERDSTAAGVVDYKRITVTVTGPGLTDPVARTTSVAKP